MSDLSLTQTRLHAGVWEGVLSGGSGDGAAIRAVWQGQALDGLQVTAVPGQSGRYAVRLPLPASILTEGVQTVVLHSGDEVLAQVTIVAGVPLEEDLRAEISLLRAELDLLKRAFRRHCAETAG